MRKQLLFLAISLLPLASVFAQITITQSDMPSAGDTLRVSYSNDSIDPLLTDTNYLWDYSYLTPNSQWVNRFDNPSTFVFPFNLLFSALNTSYGLEQYTPDSIPGIGIALDNAYGFFKKSSSALKQNGLGLTINALPVPFQYNPQDVIYNFPVNYGDMDSCNSEFGPPSIIPLPFYYGQKIHRVNNVDGWGTLITPYGTFPALRVKTLLTIRDTFADSTGMGFAFTRPLQYEFKWLTQGGKIPYLQVNATDAAGTPVVTQISYRDSMRTGVIQIGINEPAASVLQVAVYPNPSSNYFVLEYSLEKTADVSLELLSMDGKKIASLRSGKQNAGKHAEVINRYKYNLAPGIYFVKMKAGQREGVCKLVVQ